MNFVYILHCSDGSLYTGWTNGLEKRLRNHLAGKAAKYTRSRRPVKLVYLESFDEKGRALSREAQIKKLPRKEKLLLIQSLDPKTASLIDGINRAVGVKS